MCNTNGDTAVLCQVIIISPLDRLRNLWIYRGLLREWSFLLPTFRAEFFYAIDYFLSLTQALSDGFNNKLIGEVLSRSLQHNCNGKLTH